MPGGPELRAASCCPHADASRRLRAAALSSPPSTFLCAEFQGPVWQSWHGDECGTRGPLGAGLTASPSVGGDARTSMSLKVQISVKPGRPSASSSRRFWVMAILPTPRLVLTELDSLCTHSCLSRCAVTSADRLSSRASASLSFQHV